MAAPQGWPAQAPARRHISADLDVPMDSAGAGQLSRIPEETDSFVHEDTATAGLPTQTPISLSSRRVSSSMIKQQDSYRITWASRIYLHPWFENFALGLIMVNAMWIGIDLDWNGRPGSPLPSAFFDVVEAIFCLMFTLELVVRIFAYHQKEMFFYDPQMRKWNIFDLILVTFMILDTWILTYAVQMENSELSVFSSFRLLRLLRLTRILRLVPELGMLVKSMVAAVRSVASTCVLGAGIMYIFAILFTQWVKTFGSEGKCIGYQQSVCLQDYFGSMSLAFLSLMQILVFDDTFELVRPVFQLEFMYGCLFLLYILLVSFTVLNMLIGIIVDIVADVSAKEKEKLLREHVADLFTMIDADGSGTITRDEFEKPKNLRHLEQIGIEPKITKNVFDLLDKDGDSQLEPEEFIKMIFKCINAPLSEDVLEIELKVDSIADIVGMGRKNIEIIGKHRGHSGGDVGRFENSAPFLHAIQEAGNKAAEKAKTAKSALAAKREQIAAYQHRIVSVAQHLSEATAVGNQGGSVARRGQGTIHNGWALVPAGEGMQTPMAIDPPGEAVMAILRPALQTLDSRLHALRAECKASGMLFAGNVFTPSGEEMLPRQSLPPLDEVVSEVISRIAALSQSLHLPGCRPALMSPEAPRQGGEILALEDLAQAHRDVERARRKREGSVGRWARPKNAPPVAKELDVMSVTSSSI